MKKKNLILLLGVYFCFSFSSCRNGEKPKPIDIDKCESDTSQVVISEKDVNRNAILYFDCSSSMKGYVNTTNSKFNDIISSILYWQPATTAYLFDTKEKQEMSINEFMNCINRHNTNISWSDESDLIQMIESLMKKSNNIGISYLVSDGIMSGSNEEIASSIDRSFNLVRRGELTNRIMNVVSQCSKDIAVLLLKYTSNFTGTYYCYDNVRVNLDNKPRPFYVIAIGNRMLIKDFLEYVEKNEYFKNNQGLLLLGDEYHYEISLRPKTTINSKDNNYIVGANSNNRDTIEFTANLKNLPTYMHTSEYFENNGEVYVQYSQKGEFNKLGKEYISYKIDGEILRLYIPTTCIKRNAIYFKLKYDLPNWIEKGSCDNDKDIKQELIPTTFNFKYFVKGLAKINNDEYITKIDTLKFK